MSSFHSFDKLRRCKNGDVETYKAFYIACDNKVAVNRLGTDGSETVLKIGSSMRKGFCDVTVRHISDTKNRKDLFDCLIASFIIM